MNIFEQILSPFIYIIKNILLYSYQLTDSYGVSIVLLSFFISLLLLPIFIIIEKSKKKDDIIKNKMQPLIDEIKRVYKGQERYYYIKTINRQHNYSSFKALIPILSLLLQIPFFIAAFQFLDGYEPLKEVSFLFINDLSQADGLFGFINFLPIFMTLVNLLTAYFYTKNGNTSERKQMYIVAGAFLILLFNLPSGLVLYWTMNNVFSFLRLFITNPEVFKKNNTVSERKIFDLKKYKTRLITILPNLKKAFYILTTIGILIQLNWACHYNFNDIVYRILLTIIVSNIALLIFGGFAILHKTEPLKGGLFNTISLKKNLVKLWTNFKSSIIIFIILAILIQLNWALEHNFDQIYLRIGLAFIMGTLITSLFIFITYFLYGYASLANSKYVFNIKKIKKSYIIAFVFFGIIAVLSQVNWAIKNNTEDLIIRILIAISGTYIFVLLIANWLKSLKHNSEYNTHSLKGIFSSQKKELIIFWIIISLVAIYIQIDSSISYKFIEILLILSKSIGLGFFALLLVLLFTFLYKIYKNSISRIHISPKIFFSLFFLLIYFHLASLYYFTGYNQDISRIALILLIPTQIISVLYISRSKNKILCSACLLLLLLQIISIKALIYENINFIFLNISITTGSTGLSDIILLGILLVLIAIPLYIKQEEIKLPVFVKSNWLIYLFAVLYLSGFVFLWNPLAIFATDVENFVFPGISILKQNFDLFIISFFVLGLIYFILPKKIKSIWLIIILTITFLSFIHNSIIPINLGSLQQTKFLNQDNLAQPIWLYFVESLGIVILFFSLKWIVQSKFRKQTIVALVLLNIILIGQSLKIAIDSKAFFSIPEVSKNIPSSIHFSKDKKNIIYFVSDMFHGWYMKKILEDNPELQNTFSGFVWYPNTLSISSITCSTIPTLLGGYENSIDILNKDTEHTMSEKITDISENFYDKVKSQGYNFSSTDMIYSTINKNKFDTYLPKWHKDWNKWEGKLHIGVSKEMAYTLLWENAVFFSAPLFIKSKIYNDGKWMHKTDETNINTNSAKRYNLMRLLPNISTTNNKKSSFIYFHTMASHHPWDLVDNRGKMHSDIGPYKNNEWVIKTFAKWIHWMKKNDVYDNTKIVFVSDHGIHWGHVKGKIDNTLPFVNNPSLNLRVNAVKGMYPILLVKDFNSKEPIKEDWRFMSNADAYSIIFDKENPTNIIPPKTRILPSSMVIWVRKIGDKKTLPLKYNIKATNSAFDMYMWKKAD